MSLMIKVGQVVGSAERPTAFASVFDSANIKWVVPVDPPSAPLPPVFAAAEMTLMDGTKIKVTNTVDDIARRLLKAIDGECLK